MSTFEDIVTFVKEHEELIQRNEELVKENEDLRRQVEFYRSAYQEQLTNSVTLTDEIEYLSNKVLELGNIIKERNN